MNFPLATHSLHFKTPSDSLLHFTSSKSKSINLPSLKIVRASSDHQTQNGDTHKAPILQTLKTFTKAAIFLGVNASMAAEFPLLPAIAETSATVEQTETGVVEVEEEGIEKQQNNNQIEETTPLSEFIESNEEAIESLKSLLQQKLKNGEDEEALKILKQLVASQPSLTVWKFLMVRLLNEMRKTQDARQVFEEILSLNPLSFEALFENALLMDVVEKERQFLVGFKRLKI